MMGMYTCTNSGSLAICGVCDGGLSSGFYLIIFKLKLNVASRDDLWDRADLESADASPLRKRQIPKPVYVLMEKQDGGQGLGKPCLAEKHLSSFGHPHFISPFPPWST